MKMCGMAHWIADIIILYKSALRMLKCFPEERDQHWTDQWTPLYHNVYNVSSVFTHVLSLVIEKNIWPHLPHSQPLVHFIIPLRHLTFI